MKKVSLAALLLTATLTLTSASNEQHAVAKADKKLPPKAAATYDDVLGLYQMVMNSSITTKEHNVYVIDFLGEADYDATGFRPYAGHVLFNANGDFISASVIPID